MTRHGLHHTRPAATAPRLMALLVPDVVNGDPMVCFHHHSRITNWSAAYRCRNNATRQIRRSVGQIRPNASQKANSP